MHKIALDSFKKITEVEAALCHFHVSKVLKSLILAARLATGVERKTRASFREGIGSYCAGLVEQNIIGLVRDP